MVTGVAKAAWTCLRSVFSFFFLVTMLVSVGQSVVTPLSPHDRTRVVFCFRFRCSGRCNLLANAVESSLDVMVMFCPFYLVGGHYY